MLATLLADMAAVARGVVAVVVGTLLPHRTWHRFESLPIERASGLSSALVALMGLVLGARGFLAYARHAADAAVDATLALAGKPGAAAPEVTTLDLQTLSVFSVAAFVFTPVGLLAVYLVVTGSFRTVSALVGQPSGDPFFTAVEAALRGVCDRRATTMARRGREALEGPAVPDRLVTGEWANLPGIDYVVIASRRKPEWTSGATIVTASGWYTLGEPYDRHMPGGLRTFYPLTEQKVVEVLRRGVSYELPPLTAIGRNKG